MLSPFRPCHPPFWAKGPHLQTLLGRFLPSQTPEVPWERLNLKLPDGDALRIRLARGDSDVVVHLFHGLGGSADADYIRRLAARFWTQGHSVLAINHRGAGEGRGLAARPYHMGSTADMAAMIQVGRGFFPERLHVAVGFSLSATILLLLLGRDRRKGLTQPDRAIAVNPAVNLEEASLRLTRGFNRAYDAYFVRKLRAQVQERWELGLLQDPVDIPLGTTLRDFDERYTAPQGGFGSRSEYYAQCSCGPHLHQVRIPTVLLSAQDDPFATARDLEAFPTSSRIHLHIEAQGGHMGYLGKGSRGLRWMDEALDHYLRELVALELEDETRGGSEETTSSFMAIEPVEWMDSALQEQLRS